MYCSSGSRLPTLRITFFVYIYLLAYSDSVVWRLLCVIVLKAAKITLKGCLFYVSLSGSDLSSLWILSILCTFLQACTLCFACFCHCLEGCENTFEMVSLMRIFAWFKFVQFVNSLHSVYVFTNLSFTGIWSVKRVSLLRILVRFELVNFNLIWCDFFYSWTKLLTEGDTWKHICSPRYWSSLADGGQQTHSGERTVYKDLLPMFPVRAFCVFYCGFFDGCAHAILPFSLRLLLKRCD